MIEQLKVLGSKFEDLEIVKVNHTKTEKELVESRVLCTQLSGELEVLKELGKENLKRSALYLV